MPYLLVLSQPSCTVPNSMFEMQARVNTPTVGVDSGQLADIVTLSDCAKRDMAAFNIDHQNWQRLAEGRADWRRSVMEGCIKCDKAWFATLADKREKKLQSDTEPTAQRFSCQICGRPCRSRIGLFSHGKGCLHKITP
ncbi:hypothetical protein ACJJTC_005502 [Scirpophaga incertulas]